MTNKERTVVFITHPHCPHCYRGMEWIEEFHKKGAQVMRCITPHCAHQGKLWKMPTMEVEQFTK